MAGQFGGNTDLIRELKSLLTQHAETMEQINNSLSAKFREVIESCDPESASHVEMSHESFKTAGESFHSTMITHSTTLGQIADDMDQAMESVRKGYSQVHRD